MQHNPSRGFVAGLLFCSGLCALIYQTVWIREFRLIFGSSTAASAAVLGIFMGGLGLGSAVMGRRSEVSRRPLLLYGNLEIWIGISAALSPFVLDLVRHLYFATGGSTVLGMVPATALRLALSTVVLIVPTFLMGATLPAVARSISVEADVGRRGLALLYGCNTLGAVTGAALSTFFLIEHVGNRGTLWVACVLNLLVAVIATNAGRKVEEIPDVPVSTEPGVAVAPSRTSYFVMIAAASVGFVFMLMELVWYRMLSPLLGGSTFTFGLILIIALLGVGLGGALYSCSGIKRPTIQGFAFTCSLEAILIAIPYALGDRIAFFAALNRGVGAMGFSGHIVGWTVITAVVVLPAAIVAGYQFPMLIALLGAGRTGVARHTGQAYAANTLGAIAGSLAGGFGLLPIFTAIGLWKGAVLMLGVLAVSAGLISLRGAWRASLASTLLALFAGSLLLFQGPTSAWRHSGIGAGRANIKAETRNDVESWARDKRRLIIWEAEGVESSVAVGSTSSYSFIINGKSDGNAMADAGTQVMGGLVGCLVHPQARSSLVIGLGTGSTAGWLGVVPWMESVDVIELEPAILEVARMCSPVNQEVLQNPKVKIHLGDAREVLMTTQKKYDLIFSEPSNPYRAGIASLFTQEFYRSAVERMNHGGVFVQWVQAYEIDGEALQSVYATLSSVFPHVQTWQTLSGDLLLFATLEPMPIDYPQLRNRIAEEPFKSALLNAWRVFDEFGVLAHYAANENLSRAIAQIDAKISTDDRNALEFGFARGVGRSPAEPIYNQLRKYVTQQGWDRPKIVDGNVDWTRVDAVRFFGRGLEGTAFPAAEGEPEEFAARRSFVSLVGKGDYGKAATTWSSSPFELVNLDELESLALGLVRISDPETDFYLDQVRAYRAASADAIEIHRLALKDQWNEACDLVITVFEQWQKEPWQSSRLMESTLNIARAISTSCQDRDRVKRLADAFAKPFSTDHMREFRLSAWIHVAEAADDQPHGPKLRAVMDAYGPHAPWAEEFLRKRMNVYLGRNDARSVSSKNDLLRFYQNEATRVSRGLPGENNRR